ncbi:hypothetical protein IP70_01215 [alpha proteobacterium AAP38]|nr:hypothetical protein IP70_01215 [alpha proteobacterium AAP38]
MKRIMALIAALLGVMPVLAAPAWNWPDGHQAAIVLTYDDALPSHLDVAIPQLDKAGLKGTFFLSAIFDQKLVPRWRAAAARGHELGNHTVLHPCARGTFPMQDRQNSESYQVGDMLTEIRVQNTLLHAIDGQTARTFAMTRGQKLVGRGQDYVEALRTAGLVRFARSIAPPAATPGEVDPFNVPATFFAETVTGAELIAFVEEVRGRGGLGVIGFHGVGGDYSITTAQAHQQLLDYLAAHRQEIWVATFDEVMTRLTGKP